MPGVTAKNSEEAQMPFRPCTPTRVFLLALGLAAATLAGAAERLVPVSRVSPEFPREAVAAGVDAGNVKARLTVDPAGEVVRVEILKAEPRRVFDRTVIRALSMWKFAPGGDGRSMEIDLEFRR